MKYTADLPHPVRWTQSTRLRSLDEVAHRLELVLAERRVGARERAQEVEGVVVELGHRPTDCDRRIKERE